MLDGSGHFDGCFGSVMAVYVMGLLSVCLCWMAVDTLIVVLGL